MSYRITRRKSVVETYTVTSLEWAERRCIDWKSHGDRDYEYTISSVS